MSKNAAFDEHFTLRNCDVPKKRIRKHTAIARKSAGLEFAVQQCMLMLDRYLVAGGRALDLATGATIRWRLRRAPAAAMPPLFTVRGRSWLIDFDMRGNSRIEMWERPASGSFAEGNDDVIHAFRAALADARDGRPR